MKEKILGSVVMGVTSNEGVTKEKTIEVVRDPGKGACLLVAGARQHSADTDRSYAHAGGKELQRLVFSRCAA